MLKLFFFLVAAIFVLLSTAQEDDLKISSDAKKCIVPLPIFSGFDYPFVLQAQNHTRKAIHRKNINVVPTEMDGGYLPYLAPMGTLRTMEFKDSKLYVDGTVAYLRVPIKTVYRRVAFQESATEALTLTGYYACDENGDIQIIVTPYKESSPDKSFGFCVAHEFPAKGPWALYVKDISEHPKDCIDIVAAVIRKTPRNT